MHEVAENSPVDLATEFSHIEEWSKKTNLSLMINRNKTEEIVFRRPKIRHFLTHPPLSRVFFNIVTERHLCRPVKFLSPSLKKIVVPGDTENFTSWLHPQFS